MEAAHWVWAGKASRRQPPSCAAAASWDWSVLDQKGKGREGKEKVHIASKEWSR